MLRHRALVFRHQTLDNAGQAAFARQFGRVLIEDEPLYAGPWRPMRRYGS